MTNARSSHPTMEDVARAAGVSRALVSLVFRDSPKVGPIRRARVLEAAETLGYRPNAMARHLASRGSRSLGVLINDLHNLFFAEIYDGLEAEATALGYQLLLTAGRKREGSESGAIDTMLQHRVDAMILISPRLPDATIASLGIQAPLVVIGREVEGPSIDSVMADEQLGALLVVQHLAGLGHHNIVHIDGGKGAGADLRRLGYIRAMQQLGLGEPDIVPGDFNDSSGIAGSGLLKRSALPTAIFAANDLVAVGVINTLSDAGLRVPEDISVVGYDNTALADMRHVSLTTVHQPREHMGEMAVRLIDQRVEGRRKDPLTHLVRPSLITRRTTASPR